MDGPYAKWAASAEAWIARQGEDGDFARREILDPAVDSLLGDVAGLKVLDIGCGEGRYARKLFDRGAQVVALDPISAFLHRAKGVLPASHVVLADGESLPIRDAAFDVVLAYLSLLDIPDYVKSAQEMVRSCKPGGRIILVMVSNMASSTDGWFKDKDGNKLHRAVDNYMAEFSMHLEWAGIAIDNYHRPLSHLLRPFFESGAVMTDFLEPLPPKGSSEYDDEFRCPTFQVMALEKR